MSEDINKTASTAGIYSFNQFRSSIEKEIENYFKQSSVLYLFELEYRIKNINEDEKNRQLYNGFIIKTINKYVRKGQDFFTVDDSGRFITLFNRILSNLAFMIVNKIVNEIKDQFGDKITVYVGSAECPRDGSNFNELMSTSNYNLKKNKYSD